MAAALVDLQVELRRVEDDRPPAGRQLRRREQLDGLVGHALGRAGEVHRADVLVAGALPGAAGVGVAPALVLVAVDGVRLDRRAAVGDHLLGEAAVARGERLPLALGAVRGVGEGDAGLRVHRRVGGEEVGDLRLERDRERVLDERGLEAAAGGRPVVEGDAVAQGGGAGPGDPDGLGGDPVGLGGGQPVRRGEPPRAVDEDADAEALGLVAEHAGQAAGLDVDRLLAAADDADVGVRGAAGRGGVERPVGDLAHGASLAHPAPGMPQRSARGAPPLGRGGTAAPRDDRVRINGRPGPPGPTAARCPGDAPAMRPWASAPGCVRAT